MLATKASIGSWMEEATPAWKTYPYVLIDGDPELTFPAAEGDQGAESNTFYVAGRLRGRQTQREWSFLVVFAFNDVRRRLRADFFTVALFDLATGKPRTLPAYQPVRTYPVTIEDDTVKLEVQ